MSFSSAETAARSVQDKGISTDEKIDRLARAMVEIAAGLEDLQRDVEKMKRR
jgi:outer membrane murein-binding lipoprotein Lpp